MWGWLYTYCFLQSILFGIARKTQSTGSDRSSCGLNCIAGKNVVLLQTLSLAGNTSAVNNKPLSPEEQFNVVCHEYLFLTLSALSLCALVVYVKVCIDEYLETSTPTSPPWFCDGQLVMRFCGVGVAGWFLIGLVVFTHVMRFGESQRNLTCAEAIYLSSQILTTVGYGDFAPTTSPGYIFLAFYTLVGVAFFGLLFAEMINWEFGTPKQDLSPDAVGVALARVNCEMAVGQHNQKGRYDEFIHSLWPCVLATIVGTLFFHYFPGEQQPFWEALYTSVVSLTSVGFGAFHPVTQTGYLFTAAWLLLGVSATANMVVTLGNSFFKYRKEIRAEHMSIEMLEQMDIHHNGIVDKMTFLRFELVRRGLCRADDIRDILELFRELDTTHSDELEIVKLETLVRPSSTSLMRALSSRSENDVSSIQASRETTEESRAGFKF